MFHVEVLDKYRFGRCYDPGNFRATKRVRYVYQLCKTVASRRRFASLESWQ